MYYCALAVMADWVFQITFFVACLTLDARRRGLHDRPGNTRLDCCCCIKLDDDESNCFGGPDVDPNKPDRLAF